MLNGSLNTVWIIQTLQRCLPTGARLPKIHRMLRIALYLERSSLHRADNQTAARRAFAACCGVISTQAVVGILWHFAIRFALDITRSRTTASQNCGGRGTYAG